MFAFFTMLWNLIVEATVQFFAARAVTLLTVA